MIALEMNARVFLLAVSFAIASAAADGPNVSWRSNSTVPLVQLTGEHFQMNVGGRYFSDFTPARTASNAGLLGADLGYPVVYADKILIFFGDSLGVFRGFGARSDRYYLAGGPRGSDSIGYIPNGNFEQCRFLADVESQLQRGVARPTTDANGCPVLRLYRNPRPAPGEPAFMPTTIDGLEGDEATGPFETSSGAFDWNGRIYMSYVVKIQEGKPHLALRSIIARAEQPTNAWNDRNPPQFRRLYTVSSHDRVADPADAPDEGRGGGKFMFNPVAVMSREKLVSSGIATALPPQLRQAPTVVFVFGSSFRYNRSNLYLAAFAASDVEAGTGRWFYFTGDPQRPQWSRNENDAVPLLGGSPNIGNHSVVWNDRLRCFVLMYGNVLLRTATNPWGPWSQAAQVFAPDCAWARELIHRADDDGIRQTVMQVFRRRTNAPFEFREEKRGVPYGPYVLDKYADHGDGSVDIFFTMSAWVPYQVFLMKTTLEGR